MATLRTLYEVAVRGGTESEAQLRNVGKVGAEAFKKIDDAAKAVPKSLRAVDAAAEQVKGNLQGVAQQLGTVGTAANALGGIGTLAAAGVVGVAALGTALGNMARNAADSAGKLVDLSDLTGVSTKALQAYAIAAQGAGVSQDAFGQAIQTFTKNVGDAELGTGRLTGKLKLLDPTFLGLINNAVTVEEKFDLAIKKINELPAGAERASLAIAFFGQEGAKIANVGESVADVTSKFEALGAVIGDDLLRAADRAGDALDESTAILQAQISALETQAAPAILGYEKAWVDGAGRIVASLRDILAEIGLINKAAGDSFTDLASRRAGLSGELAGINRDTGSGLETGASSERRKDLEAEIAAIDHWEKAIRGAQKTQQAASDSEAANLKRNHDLKQGELAEIRAQEALQKKLDAEAKKGASEAAAAQKKAAADHAAGLAKIVDLEKQATTAGLEGVEKLEAERDVAYAKFAELVEKDGLNQEEAARGYLAIWTAADRDITKVRADEAEKQAAIAQRAAEKEAKAAARLAEQAAEAWQRPLEDFAGNIGDLLGDALTGFVEDGKLEFDDLWKGFLDAGLRAIGQLVSEQIKLNIVAAVTGQQQPGQILNLFGGTGTGTGSSTGIFNRLLSGITDLGSDVFGLSSGISGLSGATLANTSAIADWTQAVGFTGITETGAGFTGAAEAGASAFPETAASGVTGGAGASVAVIGGIFAGVLGAVLGTVGALDALRRGRRFTFTQEEVVDLLNKGAIKADPFGVAKIVGAPQATRGALLQNPSVMDRTIVDVLTIGTAEIPRLLGVLPKGPTHGTALRATFEKFIESQGDDGANVGFFSGNRFRRGIGQDATRELLKERFAFPRGVKGFDGFSPPAGAFVVAMRDVIQAQKESIGLGDKQLQQFTGLAAAFRATIGKKAGSEEQRTLGIIADTLGSLEAGGVKAAEAMAIVGQAIAALGEPTEVFRRLNEFFTSKHNDINVQDYADAVQGLAQVMFTDLPLGVRAADLALEEFHKDGVVTFEELTTRVQDVSAAANLLVPTFEDLANAIVADPGAFLTGGLVTDETIKTFHDSVLTAMRDATVQGFVQGMLQAVLAPTVLEPFTKTARETIAKVTSGEITPEAGLAILTQAGQDAAASLDALDPFIRQFITDVATLSASFDKLSGKAASSGVDPILRSAFSDLGALVGGSAKDFLVNGDIASEKALDSFHDAVLTAMRDATIEGFTQAMVDGALKEAVLAPFTALATETFAKITSGEISPEEGVRRLNAAFADADSALHKLDPALQTFIKNVANLSNSIGGGAEFSARDVAGASLDRQLLGALDPQLAKQFDLELVQRQRLHDAKELGLDLTKVERLNALEREAIAQDSADGFAKIEQDRADQIQRVMDQFFAGIERNLEAIRDLVTSLTASPASPLPPEVAFANAKANLQQLFAAARGGDADALAKIPQAFEDAEGLARQLFGSTDRFFAFFGPALAQLKASGALDAKSFALSKDAQAQIDAINKAAHEQIDTENKHHAEAMELFQAMLDALTLNAEGDEIVQRGGGSGPGDFKTEGRLPGARFDIDSASQATAQSVLAGLVPGGQTEQFLTFLGGLSSWQAVQGWAATSGPIGHLAATLLAIAPGVNSLDGWRTLVGAFRGKIQRPDVFSPVLGFASGGSFLVPGRPGSGDIFPVLPSVRASPGETVTVTTHGMDQALRDLRDVNARIGIDTVATLRALQAQNAELLGRVATLERAILGEVQRPRVVPLQGRVL